MSILRTQSFLFTLVLLVPLVSTTISVSQAQIIAHVPHSTGFPSPLVYDAVYTTNEHSTAGPSSFLWSPTPTTESAPIGNRILGAVMIDVSGRDDMASPASSEGPISSALDSSSVEPPTSIASTLLPLPTTSASSEASTTTSRDSTVPLSAVVGGAVGGSVVLVGFIVFIFVTRRQRSHRIEPYTLQPDIERPEPRERHGHGRKMNQHPSSASSIPIIGPPVRKQCHAVITHPDPLLPPATKPRSLYDRKVALSTTSLHSTHTSVPETPFRRTFSQNYDDAASVISRASSEYRRHRPLPRPPTDKPPPVPALPRDVTGLPRPRPNIENVAITAQPTLAAPSQSLASSATVSSTLSPTSPIDIDIGDYTNPGTSPLALSPARRDSQLLEPSGPPLLARSPRRLPAPPGAVSVSVPPSLRNLSLNIGSPTPNILTNAAPTPTVESEMSMNLHFDADGRPDSPSVAKMYAELLELQRQVARLREGLPERAFGEAPPEYAESVVGSVVGGVHARVD